MRHASSLLAAMVLLGALGCKPPPKEQAVSAFKRDVQRYFDDLNREALDRKDRVRTEVSRARTNPHMDPATGIVYSTFVFDVEGFVAEGYKCQGCGTSLLLTSPGVAYLCPSCRHSPYRSHTGQSLTAWPCTACGVGADGKVRPPGDDLVSKDGVKAREGATVKDMFELTQENPEKPLLAKVRYVRKLWAYDPRATVQLSQAARSKATSDMEFLPTEGATIDPTNPKSAYGLPGFHRLDGTFVGEIEFQWKGGTLTERGRQPEAAVRPWKDLTTVGK